MPVTKATLDKAVRLFKIEAQDINANVAPTIEQRKAFVMNSLSKIIKQIAGQDATATIGQYIHLLHEIIKHTDVEIPTCEHYSYRYEEFSGQFTQYCLAGSPGSLEEATLNDSSPKFEHCEGGLNPRKACPFYKPSAVKTLALSKEEFEVAEKAEKCPTKFKHVKTATHRFYITKD